MKKKYLNVIAFLLLFIFILSGCSQSNVNLDDVRLQVLESNIKVEMVTKNYEKSEKLAQNFDTCLKELLQKDYDSAVEDLLDANSDIISFFDTDNVDYYSFLLSLCGEVYQERKKEAVELNLSDNLVFYHFLNESTGEIEEFIIFNINDKTLHITLNWSSGFINEIKIETI